MTLLGVVGSRDFWSEAQVRGWLDGYHATNPLEGVVSGGARGVDRVGEEWAYDNGLYVASFRPVNTREGEKPWAIDRSFRGAGISGQKTRLPERFRGFAAAAFVRNGYIVEMADAVVAFWDGRSSGTRHTINAARAAGKLIQVVR